MFTPLHNKRIILGVTGSIAAYKGVDLASKLTQAGGLVDVILTQSATRFVTPLTFQSVTGRTAFSDSDLWGSHGHVLHVGLAKDANLILIAPITANTIAKLAHGISDNLLTVTALASRCPILLAPAMDGGMFTHSATQKNLEILKGREAIVIGPVEGHLASGLYGIGRMVEPVELLGRVRYALSRGGPLRERKIIITAGGTQEAIDPIRFITNRSSGKQGFALAQAALDKGADVILISAPTHLPTPVGAKRVDVQSTQDMQAAVLEAIPDSSALIMAAAVADFRTVSPSSQKIKKEHGAPELSLEPTQDILESVAIQKSTSGYPEITVGFAAESQDLLKNARQKLEAKDLDLIIANDITRSDAGFAVDTNRVTIIDGGGGEEVLPLLTKEEVAQSILERVMGLLSISG